MRRLLSILLLLLTALPLAAPLLAMSADAEAGLPACCRRHGQHHCAMNMATVGTSATKQNTGLPEWRSAMQCCRMYGTVATALHPDTVRPAAASVIFAGLVNHPAVHAQVESQYRLARDRARQKRGPPAPSS